MASWSPRSKSEKWPARCRPGALPQAAIAIALRGGRLTPADVNCVALVRPFAQEIHLTLRAQFPNAQIAHGGASRGARRIGLLSVAIRRRHRADARSRRRFPFRRPLARIGQPAPVGKRSVLSGFARRSVQPRDGVARLQRRSATNTKSSGCRPPIPASSFLPLFEEILGSSDWPCINRSFFDSDRLSQGGFSEKFYSRLGIDDGAGNSRSTPSAARGRAATRHRKRWCCVWPGRRKICASPAAWQ